MASGMRSQLIGDRAETKVRDALLDAEVFCAGFEKDRGEDFLVELEGYISPKEARPEPRIGLIQVKGLEEASASHDDDASTKRGLDVLKLRRWAAYPLPVFIVAVDLYQDRPHFFAQSVDTLINEQTSGDLAQLDQVQLTLSVPFVRDLATFLRAEIEAFYDKNAFDLSRLDALTVARSHYEILSTTDRIVPPTAQVWMKQVRVLWKGPWRPAHFWATLNHVADRLLSEYGGRPMPLMATIHVYRSLMDQSDNNAIAHMTWVEDAHPNTDAVRGALKWERAKHLLRFRFNVLPNLESLPESYVQNEPDEAYLRRAEQLWSDLDLLCERLLSSLDSSLRVNEATLKSLESDHHKLDDYWNTNVGYPSPQYRVMAKMLGHYMSTVDSALFWTRGKDDVNEATRRRWLAQDIKLVRGYHGAFVPLKKAVDEG